MRGRGQNRGRGRGGRGRGRGRGGQSRPQAANDWDLETEEKTPATEAQEPLNVNNMDDLKNLFTGTAECEEHYTAQETNATRYMAGMAVLEKRGVEVSSNARVRSLASAWSRKDYDMADTLLQNKDRFGLVEVLKAITLLDSSRRVRVEEKKLKRLQIQTGDKVKPRVLGKFKSAIDNLNSIKPKRGSASGALCKHLKQWTRTLTAAELEYYALHFPTEPWRKLADICHFNPKKDFPNLEWFLPYCFGSPAPEGSLVSQCRDVTADNVNRLLEEFAIPYTHVKSHKDKLTNESKAKIAQTDKLDQIIWWYEDLQCSAVDETISCRLDNGEVPTLSYGKLMERLLTMHIMRKGQGTPNLNKAPFITKLIPMAEKRLREISLCLEAPVVVIGDRSASMDVAIRTSTIIASLLTAITSARLVFFDSANMEAPFIPTNIEEVLEMAVTIKTGGSTAPAASLYPFYEEKAVVKTFIIVTDEEENTSHKSYRFAPLFKKYREEIYNARLVFVSFLRNQHSTGAMIQELADNGVTENIMQFKFDQARPDLTKFDKLFGLLSVETQGFETEVEQMETEIVRDGLSKVFGDLNVEQTIK